MPERCDQGGCWVWDAATNAFRLAWLRNGSVLVWPFAWEKRTAKGPEPFAVRTLAQAIPQEDA